VSNTSTIISGKVMAKILCLEVDEEIFVPGIIQGDVKEMFIRKVFIDGGIGSVGRKCHNEFDKDKGFLSLGC
jgi:hypothetical protein